MNKIYRLLALVTMLLIFSTGNLVHAASCHIDSNGKKTCCMPTHVGMKCCYEDTNGNPLGCKNFSADNANLLNINVQIPAPDQESF